MKSYSLRIMSVFLSLLFIASLFFSCASEGESRSDSSASINVGIIDGAGYTVRGESVSKTVSGGSATFTVIPDKGFKIVGFSHSDYRLVSENTYEFNNILYPTVIEVLCTTATGSETVTDDKPPVTSESSGTSTSGTKEPVTADPDTDPVYEDDPVYKNTIIYLLNGGEYSADTDALFIFVTPDTSHHKRVNTLNGNNTITRRGFTLVGWSTLPGGEGEFTGLGSRVTLNPNGALCLYAVWSRWTPSSHFTFVGNDTGLTVTGYNESSAVNELSIPAEVNGIPVTAVAKGAVTGSRAKSVVLPSSVKTIEDGAFESCALTDLTFFDTVTLLNDEAFKSCPDFSTLHINAYKAPYYLTGLGGGKLDAYDSLILSKKKCIVFFAGSSVLYGIDAERAEDAFNGEYDVINLGWTAPKNAMFQIEIITALLGEGDIFIHAPEYISSTQLMRAVSMGASAWQLVEANLDLFAFVDIRDVPSSLTSFTTFTNAKDALTTKNTYDAYFPTLDGYGYRFNNRPVIHDADWTPNGSAKVNASLLTDIGILRLQRLYSAIEQKGATVYLSYPPFDINYLDKSTRDDASLAGYAERFESIGYPVLGSMKDFMYTGDYFNDTEFHLVTNGAKAHTDSVVAKLLVQMKKDSLPTGNE